MGAMMAFAGQQLPRAATHSDQKVRILANPAMVLEAGQLLGATTGIWTIPAGADFLKMIRISRIFFIDFLILIWQAGLFRRPTENFRFLPFFENIKENFFHPMAQFQGHAADICGPEICGFCGIF
jgi:hypothetical protein